MRSKRVGSLFSLVLCLALGASLFAPAGHAEVLFSDHFDSQPDWNTSQSASLLEGWDQSLAQNRGGAYEAGVISAVGAHGDSGKGFTQYWDQTTGYGYAQDCWLMKNNVGFPDEWYLGYWFRHDPEWDWGGASSLKLLKVHFNNGTTWDIYATNFCAGCPDWRVPSGCGFSWCTDEYGRNWAGCWNSLGPGWHSFIWHFQHSTGTLELSVDGQPAMKTTYDTSYPGTGWESGYGISFGGNITNGGGGKNEMWTQYDDVVLATTLGEVEAFLGLGGGEPDTTPPFVSSRSPAADATDVPVDAAVTLHVQDAGAGVDEATITLTLNGSPVTPSISGTAADYTVTHAPAQPLEPGSAVQVAVNARDLAGNVMPETAYAFTTAAGEEPPPPDPETYLEDGFEDASLAARGWYDGTSGQTVVADAERGGNVLEFQFPAAGATQTTVGALRHAVPETDTVYVRYYVKYAENWSWTGQTFGPHEIYLLTNQQSQWSGPAYTNLTAYIEANNGHPHLVIQDGMNINVDHINEDLTGVTEERAVAGGNGCGAPGYAYCSAYNSGGTWNNGKGWKAEGATLENGTWHLVEAMFQMNSIQNGAAVADGQVKYWLNGEPVMSHENVVLRTGAHPDMKFNQVMIAPYFHTGVPEPQRFWLDDFVVANHAIGGDLPAGDVEAPAAPTGLSVSVP